MFKVPWATPGFCLFFTNFVRTANPFDYGWQVMIFYLKFRNDDVYKHVFTI